MISYGKENDLDGAEELLAEYLKFMHIKIQGNESDKHAPSDKLTRCGTHISYRPRSTLHSVIGSTVESTSIMILP